MSQGPSRAGQGRRRRGKKPKAVDLWRPVPSLPVPEPIVRAGDATVVVRSLGAPPLKGQGTLAEAHLALAVERAADMAMALALSAGLMADPAAPDDD
ncbi:MAG TPA: hypothetical protein VEW93_03200 [Acidimicrobiales bacterium]|nr:hypothetical protein [Acidimicrobiales bacterium]